MDSTFERNYREVLLERLRDAFSDWRCGDQAALCRLEDALTALPAQQFGIPKSSITKLWTLERLAVRKTPAPESAS